MKLRLPLYFLLLTSPSLLAQEKNIRLSLSSGVSNSSSKGKDNTIGNGLNFQADAFIPVYNCGSANNIELGFTVGGNLTRSKNLFPNNGDAAAKYNLYNTPVTFDSKLGKKYSNSFSILVGLQSQFGFGNFYLAPSINSGYMNMELEGFTQTGSANINGGQQEKDLVKRDKQTVQGILLKPQLKMGYCLTRNVSFFASAAMVTGPKIENTNWYIMPKGGFNENNTYEISQLASGTWTSTPQASSYNFTEFNIGVSFSLGKKSKTKRPGGAASASYAAPYVVAQPGEGTGNEPGKDQPSAKSISEKGVKRNEGSAMARPGNPIGGIIVKGGKNPGGNLLNLVSDEKGQISFEVKEAGNYLFQLTMPEQPAGKSISQKGVKRTEGSNLARPGTPIGGIVVKGGKNPGGNLINVISNSNGEIMLNDLEAGSYLLILQTPETNNKKDKKTEKGNATPGMKDNIKTNV
ncbi:MAG: hypothetical protein J7578_14205 [Chitinophagaceae bacterium]|nr:hypothetical protein [Chitinophagaceae bacterium]